MAVARITATKEWYDAVLLVARDQRKMCRELLAARDRAGRTAELNCEEVRTLAARLPEDEHISAALQRIEESEERDRQRSVRTRAMMDQYRGRPPGE